MVRGHLRESAYIPFLICVEILVAGQSPAFVQAKEFNADKKGDKRGCTQIGQCGSDRTGSLPTQCSLSFVSGQTFDARSVPHVIASVARQPP
jgi:hypothetical protein